MNGIASVLLGAWLAVWFFWIGTLLGALANVWLHNLTGGAWGEAIRGDLLRLARQLPWVSLLALPLGVGMHALYPWAAQAAQGALRWHGTIAAPEFKSAWLSPAFWILRAIAYLAIWNVLGFLSQRPAFARSPRFSAFALIAYGVSSGLAAVDWIMALMPEWYSSVFGWLVDTGQLLAGMAFAIAFAFLRRAPADAQTGRDLGNLLLCYVLSWAYLAFSQFLIIWAENLPHEIHWYVVRGAQPWLSVSRVLALGLFALPLLLLLSRRFKQTPALLGGLGVAVLALQLLDTAWLVLPSIDVAPLHWIWAMALAIAIALAGGAMLWRRLGHAAREPRHA